MWYPNLAFCLAGWYNAYNRFAAQGCLYCLTMRVIAVNIETIREFVTLADIGNYEEAAFHLFITQSALSKHVQGLEAELGGLPLLSRGHGKAELTEFGRRYYPYAAKIVQLHDDFMNRSSAGSKGKDSIRIGCPPHMDAYGFFHVIKAFCKLHPECSLLLEDEQVTKKLRVGEIDIAILFEEPFDMERNTCFLVQDRLVPILPAAHPLAGKPQFRLSDLRNEPFVFFSPRLLMEKYCKELCSQAGFEPRIAHSIAAPDCRNLINLVSQNFGVSIIPEQEARYWANPGIVIAEPDITFTLNICAQYEKSHTLSEIEGKFIEFLKAGN